MHNQPNWALQPDLNEVEKIKLQKDGLDIIRAITDKYAAGGYASITPEDLNLFKWAGVYEQKPRNGYFMMRVRIGSGILGAAQAEVLAGIAEQYAGGIASITTRGAVQFHGITVEQLPDIFAQLSSCGLCSFEACGDCPRTIVGNPLAGVDPDELLDTTEIVQQLEQFFLGNRAFSNLPRKYKISVSASPYNAAHAQMNDISFTPAVKVVDGEEVKGFHVWAGGGLSAQPRLAQRLDLFVRPEEVLRVAAGVCTLFREHGYRNRRTRARMKFLMEDWGAEKFTDMVPGISAGMRGAGKDLTTQWNASYYYGVHPQKQAGLCYIGFGVPVGELTGEELRELAALSRSRGDGTIRTTLTQNLILTGVRAEDVQQVLKNPVFDRLHVTPCGYLDHTVVCTGSRYCNLALIETKHRAAEMMEKLDAAIQLDTPVRIHIAGCPNSCGQRQIADLSLQGAKLRTENGVVEAFDLFAGGTLTGEGTFAEKLGVRVPADTAHLALEKILRFYAAQRQQGELFANFVGRVGAERLAQAAQDEA